MSVESVVTPTLNREDWSGKFMRKVERPNVVRQRLTWIPSSSKDVVHRACVACFQSIGQAGCRNHELCLCCRGNIPVLDGLQMLAIQDQFSGHLEDLVRDAHHAKSRVFWPLCQVSANCVNCVPDEDRLDETQLVITVDEGVDIIVSHQPQAQTEDH